MSENDFLYDICQIYYSLLTIILPLHFSSLVTFRFVFFITAISIGKCKYN